MPTTWSQEIYLKAWNFSAIAHEGQKYQGSQPGMEVAYINHIGSVTMELIWALNASNERYDENLAIQCALLHDVLEDTKITLDNLQESFGSLVAKGVLALTKDPKIPDKKERLKDSLSRIQQQPKEIWMVKLADRITNLAPPPFHWPSSKVSAYKEESELILKSLGESNHLLADRLSLKIKSYNT